MSFSTIALYCCVCVCYVSVCVFCVLYIIKKNFKCIIVIYVCNFFKKKSKLWFKFKKSKFSQFHSLDSSYFTWGIISSIILLSRGGSYSTSRYRLCILTIPLSISTDISLSRSAILLSPTNVAISWSFCRVRITLRMTRTINPSSMPLSYVASANDF